MTLNGKKHNNTHGIGYANIYNGRSLQKCSKHDIVNQNFINNMTEEARLSSLDFTSCVKASTGIPRFTDSYVIQTVSNIDIYINQSMAVLKHCNIPNDIHKGQVCFKNEKWCSTNRKEDDSDIPTSDIYENRDYNSVSNVKGFTIGDTNIGLHCTTVHSVQKCQVSTGCYNNEILDHAATYTNTISDGEPFHYCSLINGQISSIYSCNMRKFGKLDTWHDQDSHSDSICSASYREQANDEWVESSIDRDLSYSYVKVIENMLGEYCDLGIQPHNTNSQEFTVSYNNISISSDYEYFSSVFSQGEITQSVVIDYQNTNNIPNKLLMGKNNDKTLGTALVPYQAKCQQREFGFIPDYLPIFQKMPVATEIVWENSEKWLNLIHKAVKKYNLPNYQGARIPVPSGLNIPMWRYILADYDLPIIGDYLQFGFPINVDSEIFEYNIDVVNHKSALQRKEGVAKYFTTEVNKKAIMGPFEHKPFSTYALFTFNGS